MGSDIVWDSNFDGREIFYNSPARVEANVALTLFESPGPRSPVIASSYGPGTPGLKPIDSEAPFTGNKNSEPFDAPLVAEAATTTTPSRTYADNYTRPGPTADVVLSCCDV